MNKTLLALLLVMSIGLSYSLVEFNSSDEVNMYETGGFYMQVLGDTDESVSNLTAFVTIVKQDSKIPAYDICKYEDEENCYLYTTDNNGRVEGQFQVNNQLVIGNNYTLRVTIGNVTSEGNFSVVTMRDLSWTTEYPQWLTDNIMFFIMLLIVVSIVLILTGFFFFGNAGKDIGYIKQ